MTESIADHETRSKQRKNLSLLGHHIVAEGCHRYFRDRACVCAKESSTKTANPFHKVNESYEPFELSNNSHLEWHSNEEKERTEFNLYSWERSTNIEI